jgi:hypothetical protein
MIKLKDDDIIKFAEFIKDKCKGSPVYLELSNTGKMVLLQCTTVLGEKVTVELYDVNYYQNPKKTISEEL